MADFDSWSKHSLVQFAQQAQQALTAKDEIIAELTAQVKAVHLAWRLALAQPVASDTLSGLDTQALDERGRNLRDEISKRFARDADRMMLANEPIQTP